MLIAYAFLAVGGFVIAFTCPWLLPGLIVLAMPAGNFEREFFVTLSFTKVLTIMGLLGVLARAVKMRDSVEQIRIPQGAAVFWLFAIFISVVNFGGSWSGVVNSDAVRSPALRSLVQISSLSLRVGVGVLIASCCRTMEDVIRVFRYLFIISFAVAAYGLYQVVAFPLGLPVMGIWRAQADSAGGFAVANVGGAETFRLSSFVGEPKMASKFLLPSITGIFIVRSLRIPSLTGWYTGRFSLLVHAVAFALTYSSSGYFTLAVISVPTVTIALKYGQAWRRWLLISLFSVLVMGFGLIVFSDAVENVLVSRGAERVNSADYPEQYAFKMLQEHPEYVATGIGVGNITFAIRPYLPDYQLADLTVDLQSYYLQCLIELGMVGFLAYTAALFLPIVNIWRLRSFPDAEISRIALVCVVVGFTIYVQNTFVSTEYSSQTWMIAGLSIALSRIARVQRYTQHTSVGEVLEQLRFAQ